MTLHAFDNPRVAFPALAADAVCSGRAVSENSCIRGSCLFGEGSIAYDRLFASIPQKSELNCCTAELPDCLSLVSCTENQYCNTVP